MVQPILLGTSSSSSPAGLQWEQDQHLHQRCHSCCHDNRILPPRHRCSPPLLQSPDSGMQPLSSSFYMLPTCSRLYQNDNLLGVPQVPGCIWTRLTWTGRWDSWGYTELQSRWLTSWGASVPGRAKSEFWLSGPCFLGILSKWCGL